MAKITMKGLVWKKAYKKEPVGFGIHNLVIGAYIQDDLVSPEDVE